MDWEQKSWNDDNGDDQEDFAEDREAFEVCVDEEISRAGLVLWAIAAALMVFLCFLGGKWIGRLFT